MVTKNPVLAGGMQVIYRRPRPFIHDAAKGERGEGFASESQ
jgi:hypothetical protein